MVTAEELSPHGVTEQEYDFDDDIPDAVDPSSLTCRELLQLGWRRVVPLSDGARRWDFSSPARVGESGFNPLAPIQAEFVRSCCESVFVSLFHVGQLLVMWNTPLLLLTVSPPLSSGMRPTLLLSSRHGRAPFLPPVFYPDQWI